MQTELNTDSSQIVIDKATGFGTANCDLINAGVLDYRADLTGLPASLGKNGRIRVWYDPAEFVKPETMTSFHHIPLTIDHPDSENGRSDLASWDENGVGELSTDIEFVDNKLRGTLKIKGKEAVSHLVNGIEEVSLAIKCNYDLNPGTTPDGEDYDVRAIDMRGDHCAIVKKGKAGSNCRINTDTPEMRALRIRLGGDAEQMGADAPQTSENEDTSVLLNSNANKKETDKMAKKEDGNDNFYVTLKNTDVELCLPDEASKVAVQTVFDAIETTHNNAMILKNTDMENQATEFDTERTQLNARIAELEAAASPEAIAAQAQVHGTLMNTAAENGIEVEGAEKMSPKELTFAILKNSDLESRGIVINDKTTDAEAENLLKALPGLLKNSADETKGNSFSGKTVKPVSSNSGQAHLDALSNAWKTPTAQKGA